MYDTVFLYLPKSRTNTRLRVIKKEQAFNALSSAAVNMHHPQLGAQHCLQDAANLTARPEGARGDRKRAREQRRRLPPAVQPRARLPAPARRALPAPVPPPGRRAQLAPLRLAPATRSPRAERPLIDSRHSSGRFTSSTTFSVCSAAGASALSELGTACTAADR